MLAITGYADRWSVRQGGDIKFMIAVKGGGRYSARIARVICGDPNPKGPGYREIPVKWDLEGQHDGIEQTIAKGSWVDIPVLALPGGPVGFAATIWPTLLAAGKQAVLNWAGAGGSLTVGIGERGAFARLATSSGIIEVETGIALTERAWHDIACLFDPATGVLSIAQAPRKIRLDHDERATKSSGAPRTALAGTGAAAIAAEREDQRVAHHFNGKIERPRITDGGGGLDGLIAAQGSGAAAPSIAEWDFSIGIPTDAATDIGPAKAHGTCINLPTRAMTGSRWTGGVAHRWTEEPKLWGAIHFHDDDIGDSGWQPSLAFTVPEDWQSGVYALHLEKDGARDNIVFYVRARVPGSQARVAFLAPTFSYTVYSQYQKKGRQALITERSLAWGALAQAPDGHPEYGVSPYNFHSDGSGVVMSTMRRPLIDKRVNQIHLVDPSDDGSGLYWISADSAITDLLTRKGIDFEVITDHDVHAEGVDLLSKYAVVLTGQHPEYHTHETLDALSAYLGSGGRFMYLGGNGFYWKVVPHATGTWAFELRRAEGGIRLWETRCPAKAITRSTDPMAACGDGSAARRRRWSASASARKGSTKGFPTPSSTEFSIRASHSCARGSRIWRGLVTSLVSAASWAVARPAMSSTAPTRALARRITPSSSAAPSLTTRPISPSTKSVMTTPGRPRVRRSSAPTSRSLRREAVARCFPSAR